MSQFHGKSLGLDSGEEDNTGHGEIVLVGKVPCCQSSSPGEVSLVRGVRLSSGLLTAGCLLGSLQLQAASSAAEWNGGCVMMVIKYSP